MPYLMNSHMLTRLMICLLLWSWMTPVWAQNLQPALEQAQPQLGFTRVPPEEAPVREPDATYPLGPGDQVSLLIWNQHINLAYDLTVNPQGEVLVPRLGVFSVNGLTLAKLEQDVLTRAMSLQRETVQVRVLLRQIRRVRVLITGYVARPGYYQVYWGTPLLEALRRAGGVRDNGSVRQLRLSSSSNNQPRLIDLFDFHFDGIPAANPLLIGGEQIHVPPVERRVAVLGEVQQPGVYEVLPGDTTADLLRWAGSLKPTADPSGIQLWSGGLDRGGEASLQPAAASTSLQGGDVIYAGARKLAITEQNLLVQGMIRQPGPQGWRRGMSLLDAIELAGGAQPTADLGSIRISRMNSEGRRELVVNLQAFLSGQNPAGNPELEPDDVISVPESFFVIRNITELTTLVISALGIVSVVINLSRGGQ